MNKTELKNLLLKNFEERLNALVLKIQTVQAELAKDVEEFRAEYGNIGIAALGSLALPLIKPVVSLSVEESEKPAKTAKKAASVVRPRASKMKSQSKHRRKRRNPKINISALLLEKLPQAVKALGKIHGEFTSRQVFNYLAGQSTIPCCVKLCHVSLVLGKNKRKLGLKAVKRLAGKPITKPTNFFSLAKQSQAKK